MASTEQVVKQLKDRELELIQQAASRVELAQNVVKQAQGQLQLFVNQYMECLELLTGDTDPQSLSVDIGGKKIFRTIEKVPRKGRRMASTKGRGKKTGGGKT